MNKLQLITAAAAINGALLASPLAAFAVDSDSQRIEELDQKVKVLERKLEIQQEDADKKAKETPVIKAGEKGFSLESKDSAFQFKLRGLLQADYRNYQNSDAPKGADTFLLRRVRPIFEGTLYDKYDFRFVPDFGGGKSNIQDAYIEARFLPQYKLRAGKYTVPVGLERIQSETDTKFAERGLPTNLVPNRDIGLQLSGDFYDGLLTYSFGAYNGSLDGRSSEDNPNADLDSNDHKDLASRLFAYPFLNSDNFALRGLGLGIAATTVEQGGDNTNVLLPAGYRSFGQATFFKYRSSASATNSVFAEGKRNRLAPQLSYYYGPLGVLGEYTIAKQGVRRINGAVDRTDQLENNSWQVAASYLITGEDATFSKGVNVKNPFTIGGPGWGAFEVAARYGQLDIDNDAFTGGADSFADPNAAASKASETAVGVNWYFNRNVKAVLDYAKTDFNGGAAGGADRATEKVLISRLQLAF